MPARSRTAVAVDYEASAERERSLAVGLEASGNSDQAEIHYGAARHFADKAELTTAYVAPTRTVLGEAVDRDSRVIAWRPRNTLHEPEQIALDASAERKELLLGPAIDVCALALDATDSIGAQDSLEKMLGHQLALAHKLSFEFANRAVDQRDPAVTARYMHLSIRLMGAYQQGLMTIQKLRSGNTQTVTVQHVHVSGGQALITGTVQAAGASADLGGAQ
jgi:hypothetical protein